MPYVTIGQENSATTDLYYKDIGTEHEGIPQSNSLRDSSVSYALIAIAQEVAELLKQAYPAQAEDDDSKLQAYCLDEIEISD